MKKPSGLIITFCTAIVLTGFAIGTNAFGTIHGGSGIAAGNGYLHFGTNIILYTCSGNGKGYFYNGRERGDPIVYFGDIISPSPCPGYSGYDSYQGVGVIQEFTSASNHVFTDQYPHIVFGARNSNCYQGILLFYQNGLYGGIEPVVVDANEYLYYNWWYDDSGASDFSHWVAPTGDRDNDGIYDNEDNCLDTPNGPSLGTCYAWSGMEVGTTCRRDIDCGGLPKSCSMNQEDLNSDGIGDACDNLAMVTDILSVADGHYQSLASCFTFFHVCNCSYSTSVFNGIDVGYEEYCYGVPTCSDCNGDYLHYTGIAEFDIANTGVLFPRGQLEAQLHLTAMNGDLANDQCLSLYSIQDANENGIVEEGDRITEEYIGEACHILQPGNTVIFDVTSAISHDLFDPEQTGFSGFVIQRSSDWNASIEFYDHTDPENGPRLKIFLVDTDDDGIIVNDNCPDTPNGPMMGSCYSWSGMDICTTNNGCIAGYCSLNQEDSYPAQGNGLGDACDCEADFMCDGDVDGTDASTFKLYFGRNSLYYPCDLINPCHGDFSCDGDVDGTDAALFKSDFGRSQFQNPCPNCVAGVQWCQY